MSYPVTAKINGIHIVLCVEYLMKLADFITDGLSVAPDAKSTAVG